MNLILGCLRDLFHYDLVGDLFFVILAVFFNKTVDHLTFFQAAVSDRRQNRIPVTKSVFFLHDLHVFRLQKISQYKSFRLAVGQHHFFSAYNVFFAELFLEPLIDLILRLCTFDDIQPVPAGTFGIL